MSFLFSSSAASHLHEKDPLTGWTLTLLIHGAAQIWALNSVGVELGPGEATLQHLGLLMHEARRVLPGDGS